MAATPTATVKNCLQFGLSRMEMSPHRRAEPAPLREGRRGTVVDAILDRIGRRLADGDRVELRIFGAFAIAGHEL